MRGILIMWLATVGVAAATYLGYANHLEPEAVSAIITGSTIGPLGFLVGYQNGTKKNGNGTS